MHLKRQKVPKTWPISRKGTKYLVVASHNKQKGVPLLIVLRDILKIADNKKEVKKILNEKKVSVNNKIIQNEKYSLSLLDVIKIIDKNYKLIILKKKFALKEIDEKEAGTKTSKIIGKKIMKKGKIQVNLSDGKNYLVDGNFKTGDSVLIDLKENKIIEALPLKQGANVVIISGKHIGKKGKVEDINEEHKMADIVLEDKKLNINFRSLMVV